MKLKQSWVSIFLTETTEMQKGSENDKMLLNQYNKTNRIKLFPNPNKTISKRM